MPGPAKGPSTRDVPSTSPSSGMKAGHPLDLDPEDLERITNGLARFRALGLKSTAMFVDAVYNMEFTAFGGAGAGGDSGIQMLQMLVALPPALLQAYKV